MKTNLWDTVQRGKFIGIIDLIKKLKRYYISKLTAYLQVLEQKEANPPKRSRWQDKKMKLRDEISQLETKRTIQRFNTTKSCFFEKINKIDKSLAELIKEHKVSVQ